MQREYAAAGVDYGKIDPFKAAMREIGKRMRGHALYRRDSVVHEDGSFEYERASTVPHRWVQITEGLGNKNWIAEWMYQTTGDPRHFAGIGIDTAMAAVVDLLRQGALPVAYTAEVAAGDSEWFTDEARRAVIVESFADACRLGGMALVGGESPSLRYLIKAEPPVKSAPVFSGCAVGLIAPLWNTIRRQEELDPPAEIIGIPASGLHANGISLVIKRALALPDQFLHVLPNGHTLGEEALVPTASYVALFEALFEAKIEILAAVPATGDGVAKLLRAPNSFTYHIWDWPDVPPIFQLMREIDVPLEECLRTFNWGIGLYIFINAAVVDLVLAAGKRAGYAPIHLGSVIEGERRIIFGPEQGLVLRPE